MPATDIIVIGASSGGVDALKQLVHNLSPDLPAAVFVVLHVGSHPSILPEILSVAGPLPAGHAIDGSPVENGRIYIAPPDHHLRLAQGHMHVTRGPKENNARPSIDVLFRTAAGAYGDRVVGIVLTGNLNDGTVGLWEIKRHGGVTMVQDPVEAASPSMPRSAVSNVEIDYIVSVRAMASLLCSLASGKMETEMEAQPDNGADAFAFSGVTCPECRGPLWESHDSKLKHFKCRVGHKYSFESLLEQHSIATERALWAALLAIEEETILARQAALRTPDPEAQQAFQREVAVKERRAAAMREMLTEPDLTL